MGTVVVFAILVATVFVMASGVWVAVGLFMAIRRIRPPVDAAADLEGNRRHSGDSSSQGH